MSLLDRLANRITQFYAEHVETLLFRLRSSRRLHDCGAAGRERLPVASLEFGGSDDCTGPLCRPLIRRYARYYRRFSRVTLQQARTTEGSGLLAAIDLRQYEGYATFLRQLKQRSDSFYRNARKAERRGYSMQPFQFGNHAPDIHAIRRSSRMRSCGPVIDAFVLTLDALGGAPVRLAAIEQPVCPAHWELFFGVFLHRPGYRQGEVAVHRQLVAYTRLHRIGNTVRYAEFIGHGQHVRQGVMMLLHLGVLAWLLDGDNSMAQGIEFLTYGPIEQGGAGLFFWKRKALFMPHVLSSPLSLGNSG